MRYSLEIRMIGGQSIVQATQTRIFILSKTQLGVAIRHPWDMYGPDSFAVGKCFVSGCRRDGPQVVIFEAMDMNLYIRDNKVGRCVVALPLSNSIRSVNKLHHS